MPRRTNRRACDDLDACLNAGLQPHSQKAVSLSAFSFSRLRNEGLTLAARLFAIAAGLATSAITARTLGPEDRGAYFYVVAIAAVLAQFGHLGTPGSNTYFAAHSAASVRRLARWSCILAVLATPALIAAFYGLSVFSPDRALAPGEGAIWLPLLTLGVLLTLLFGAILSGQQRFDALNLLSVSTNIVLLSTFAALYGRGSVNDFLAASALVTLGSAALHGLAVGVKPEQSSERAADLGDWLRYGGRAYLVLLLGALAAKLGILFLKSGSSGEQLGFYSVALQGFDALTLIPASVALILFPSILKSRAISWNVCRSETWRMVLIATAISLPAWFAMPLAVKLIFGEAFLPAVLAAQILLPGFVALSVVTVVSQYLAALRYPRAVMINWSVSIAVLCFTAVFIVPGFGAIGASVATSLAYGTLAVMMLRTARKLLAHSDLVQ